MTRTVTLADLAGARPCATATSTSQDAASAGNEGGSSFAHILEGAGAARHGHDEVEDKRRAPGHSKKARPSLGRFAGVLPAGCRTTATLTSGTDPGPAVSAGQTAHRSLPGPQRRPRRRRAGESTDLGLKMGPGAGSGAEEQLSHSLGTGPTATADRDSSSAGTEPTAAADRDSPSAGTELRTPGSSPRPFALRRAKDSFWHHQATQRRGAGTPFVALG